MLMKPGSAGFFTVFFSLARQRLKVAQSVAQEKPDSGLVGSDPRLTPCPAAACRGPLIFLASETYCRFVPTSFAASESDRLTSVKFLTEVPRSLLVPCLFFASSSKCGNASAAIAAFCPAVKWRSRGHCNNRESSGQNDHLEPAVKWRSRNHLPLNGSKCRLRAVLPLPRRQNDSTAILGESLPGLVAFDLIKHAGQALRVVEV